jgi:hypothetical protein
MATVAFLVGILIVPVGALARPDMYQREAAARFFFYSTMFKLLDGDYDPAQGSVSGDALATFTQHRSRLGDSCSLVMSNDPYSQSQQREGHFVGYVLFPSGDCFEVVVVRKDTDFVIERFEPFGWDLIWSEVLLDTERYYRLGYSPVLYER